MLNVKCLERCSILMLNVVLFESMLLMLSFVFLDVLNYHFCS